MKLAADTQGVKRDSKNGKGDHCEAIVIETDFTSWNYAVRFLFVNDCIEFRVSIKIDEGQNEIDDRGEEQSIARVRSNDSFACLEVIVALWVTVQMRGDVVLSEHQY